MAKNEYRARPIQGEEVHTAADVLAALPDTKIPLNMIAFREENERRAHFAATAVHAYAQQTGIATGESVFLAISDLMCDLRHLLDACRELEEDEGYPRDLSELVEHGHDRYREEISGDQR